MKEYWVNVYFHPFRDSQREYINDGINVGGFVRGKFVHSKPLYRIHVKMDGGYNKYRGRYAKMVKDLKNRRINSSIDWMG